MPIGTQLLEIVAPITEGTTAERFLLRRKGAGGYMVITQTDDHPPRRPHVEELGIRIVGQFDERRLHQHAAAPGRHRRLVPRDRPAGGRRGPDGPVEPGRQELAAGDPHRPGVGDHRRRDAVRRPGQGRPRAGRRSSQIERADVDGVPTIPLDNATLRFVPITDGRPEGLAGIDLACSRPGHRQGQRRRSAGLPVADDHVVLVGMRCYLR